MDVLPQLPSKKGASASNAGKTPLEPAEGDKAAPPANNSSTKGKSGGASIETAGANGGNRGPAAQPGALAGDLAPSKPGVTGSSKAEQAAKGLSEPAKGEQASNSPNTSGDAKKAGNDAKGNSIGATQTGKGTEAAGNNSLMPASIKADTQKSGSYLPPGEMEGDRPPGKYGKAEQSAANSGTGG